MKQKIFVVEDDEPILDLMDILIRKLGYEPVLVANGLDALEMIQKEPPALILLDIMMTPIDGWEFLEKLRGEYGKQDIPVIIFTASPAVEERMAQIHDPRLGVLHKPVSFTELREAIDRYLKH
ncbi:response regulator [Methanoregula sp.]|jgi:CheY-like chemotaxis protein|uniref:response regulator n=1 Tax=Methanoregula sp. TaxID=2052170 RepID=UPI003C1AB23C